MGFLEDIQNALNQLQQSGRGAIASGPFGIFNNLRQAFGNPTLQNQIDNWVSTGDFGNFNLMNILQNGYNNLPPFLGGAPTPTNPADYLPVVAGEDITALINSFNEIGQPLNQTTINALNSRDPQIQWGAYQSANSNLSNYRAQQTAKDQTATAISGLESGRTELSNLRDLILGKANTPLFGDLDIQSIVSKNIEGLGTQYRQNLESLQDILANRGILKSGVAADSEVELRRQTGRDIESTRRDVPISLREMNDKIAKEWLGLGSSVATNMGNYDNAIAAAKAGLPIPQINLNEISSSISGGAQQIADLETLSRLIQSGQYDKVWQFLSNTMGFATNASLGALQSLIPLLMSRQGGGGGGSSSNFSGSVGIPGLASFGF